MNTTRIHEKKRGSVGAQGLTDAYRGPYTRFTPAPYSSDHAARRRTPPLAPETERRLRNQGGYGRRPPSENARHQRPSSCRSERCWSVHSSSNSNMSTSGSLYITICLSANSHSVSLKEKTRNVHAHQQRPRRASDSHYPPAQEGQAMIEYGLIAALVSVAAVVALTAVGTNLVTVFQSVTAAMPGT